MRKLVLLLILFAPISLISQENNFELFFEVINDVKKMDNLSCDLLYEIYDDKEVDKISSSEKGTFDILGNSYVLDLQSSKTISNENKKLTVDKIKKNIFLQNDFLNIRPDIGEFLLDFIQDKTSIKLVTDTEKAWTFQIFLEENKMFPYTHITIEISKINNYYNMIVMEYKVREGVGENVVKSLAPKVKIHYSNLKTNAALTVNNFTFDKYLIGKDREKYSLKKRFENYTFYNQLLKL